MLRDYAQAKKGRRSKTSPENIPPDSDSEFEGPILKETSTAAPKVPDPRAVKSKRRRMIDRDRTIVPKRYQSETLREPHRSGTTDRIDRLIKSQKSLNSLLRLSLKRQLTRSNTTIRMRSGHTRNVAMMTSAGGRTSFISRLSKPTKRGQFPQLDKGPVVHNISAGSIKAKKRYPTRFEAIHIHERDGPARRASPFVSLMRQVTCVFKKEGTINPTPAPRKIKMNQNGSRTAQDERLRRTVSMQSRVKVGPALMLRK